MSAGARIAAGAGRAVLDRKSTKAAQLDTIPARHGGDDLAEDRVDDILHVALIEMRVRGGDALHELGLDHRIQSPLLELKQTIGPLGMSSKFANRGAGIGAKLRIQTDATRHTSWQPEGAKAPVDRQG